MLYNGLDPTFNIFLMYGVDENIIHGFFSVLLVRIVIALPTNAIEIAVALFQS